MAFNNYHQLLLVVWLQQQTVNGLHSVAGCQKVHSVPLSVCDMCQEEVLTEGCKRFGVCSSVKTLNLLVTLSF